MTPQKKLGNFGSYFSVWILFLFFLTAAFPPLAMAVSRDLPLEEIAKTEAARLFLEKKFKASLQLFQDMEREYPESLIIKRYIASLQDTLGNWEGAIAKLREVIGLAPEDLVAWQMLGDIYMKKTEMALAAEAYQAILERDSQGPIGVHAQKRLEAIQVLKQETGDVPGVRMSVQTFMQSEPARQFARGEFKNALQGFETLTIQYPQDPLVRRFMGMARMRIQQYQEAILDFQKGLEIAPENAALHYYLGQAFSASGKVEEARQEFRHVIQQDTGAYRLRAQQALFATLRTGGQAPMKPWTLNLSSAYEFDTNAAYKSSDPGSRVPGDKNSGKYTSLISGTYRVYQKGRWMVTPDFFYMQNLYNDFVNLNTYTPGVGLSVLCGFPLLGKPAFLNIREGVNFTYLRNRLYVFSNTLSNSLIYSISKYFRSTLSYRFTMNEFVKNGTATELTSRDGYGNNVSLNNTHYLNDKRNLYYSFGYEFDRADTEGKNYVKNAHGPKLGMHAPLVEKLEGDLTYGFKESNYPTYSSSPPPRREGVHTLTATLSRPLFWSSLTWSAYYTFEKSDARNNLYEYARHLFATKLALQF